MLSLYEELTAIIDTLESQGIQYALCGGIAVAVHGFTRATEDIDLLLPAEEADRAEAAVAPLGFTIRAHPMSFASGMMKIRRVSKIDAEGDLLMLDLLIVTEASKDVWETREQMTWRGRPVTVVSREGLVKLKKFRGSKLDLADIEYLENGE